MNDRDTNNHILIIADDFTGANDAGVTFAQRGNPVDVVLHPAYQSDGQAAVCVLNSDSRALTAEQAGARVLSLTAEAVQQRTIRWLVKKIDSTLRGNPGAETRAMMQAAGADVALVAPAFPAAGRTTVGGQCLVNQQPLTQTEFASDPKTPVRSADVGMVFRFQSDLPCLNIDLATLRAGKLNERLAQVTGPVMAIIDSETDADLDRVAAAARHLPIPPLLVGSAGLCDAIARAQAFDLATVSVNNETGASQGTAERTRPRLLAIVGSMSEIAQQQIRAIEQMPHVERVFVDIEDALRGNASGYRAQIVTALQQGSHCIVHTSSDSAARHRIDDLCERWQHDRCALGEKICAFLGTLAREVAEAATPDALYLSGGDVAVAASRALGATGFRITGCVAQCVPYGHFLGNRWQMPVMTKAGGFGDETTLLKVLHFIKENVSV